MDSLIELTSLYEKITRYENLIRKWSKTQTFSKASYVIEDEIKTLRTELQRDYSRLEDVIARYGGYRPKIDPIFGQKWNVFDIAFGPVDFSNYTGKFNALNDIKEIVNKAIGKLEAEGESWPVPIKKLRKRTETKAKVFISHSGKTEALTELRDYLDELGIEKLIVIKKPNLDREINVKVEAYLDETDFVIILATGDSKDRNNNPIPAGNVIHEIGLAQAKPKFKGKIIYLLEEGVDLPTNIKPKGYIRFNRDNIEHKFGDIVKEIREMGFL